MLGARRSRYPPRYGARRGCPALASPWQKAEELSAVAHKECSDALLKAEGMEKLAARSEAEVERQLGKPDLKGWQVMCMACSSRHPVRVRTCASD